MIQTDQALRFAGVSRAVCMGALTLGIGCGSSTTSSEPPPPPPPPVYTYESIAGTWEGTVKEDRTPNEYLMSITMNRTAAKGDAAAQITYYLADIGLSSDCTGSLVADAAPANDSYRFKELISTGPCVANGDVRLLHDRTAGTIGYAWYSQAGLRCCTATLRRRP